MNPEDAELRDGEQEFEYVKADTELPEELYSYLWDAFHVVEGTEIVLRLCEGKYALREDLESALLWDVTGEEVDGRIQVTDSQDAEDAEHTRQAIVRLKNLKTLLLNVVQKIDAALGAAKENKDDAF